MPERTAQQLDEKYASKIEMVEIKKDINYLVNVVTTMSSQMTSIHGDVLILKNNQKIKEELDKEESLVEEKEKDRKAVWLGAILGAAATPVALIFFYMIGHAIVSVIK